MEDDPADDEVDPSGEAAVLVAMVPDGAASEAGASVPEGADSGVDADPEGASALASVALVCPLSPAPALTAGTEETKVSQCNHDAHERHNYPGLN